MVPSAASLWIISMILLNHEIIIVNSFPISLDGLFDMGLSLLVDNIFYQNDEEVEEVTMDDIVQRIDDIEDTIMESEQRIIDELSHCIKYESAMRDFAKDVSYIVGLYDHFREYSTGYELYTLEKFAEISLTSGDNGLSYKLDDLVNLISPKVSERTPLLEMIIELYKVEGNSEARCGQTISVQQEIYALYGRIALYLLKGYATKYNAYKILQKSERGIFWKEKKSTKHDYKEAMYKLIGSAVEAMHIAPRDIRSCDPKIYEEGVTHTELKWLFNAIVIDVSYLSNGPICSQKCEFYKETGFHHVKWTSKWMQCSSKLFDCFTITGDSYFCPGTKEGIRYDAVGDHDSLKGKCDLLESTEQFKTSSIYFRDSVYDICHLCSCVCDDRYHPNTVRRFNLDRVQSDYNNNQVITGLRFVERNYRIYIEIQEGRLEPNGVIKSTVQRQKSRWSENNWVMHYGQKSVNLDTLHLPPDQVLTGIKFDVRNGRLELQIKAHSFNYSTGLLHFGYNRWKSSDVTGREEIKIDEPGIPTDAGQGNIVALGENKYVDFRMTGWKVDFSQTAVPFIDTQWVVSDPPRPLSGAGIYYRGKEGYGGFIALKLVAYDYGHVLAQSNRNIYGVIEEEEEEGTIAVAPGVKAQMEVPAPDSSLKSGKNVKKMVKKRVKKMVEHIARKMVQSIMQIIEEAGGMN